MKVLSKNNKVLLADGQAVKGQSGGIEPIEETWNIVNSQVKAYLDWVEQNPYSASDYTTSYFDDHEFTVDDKCLCNTQ